ncbi:hypothetical protein FKP32DRAFT_1176374 [Trametes sanguinea]|nr:hypothetical protein FKP32DRAFT_1176374 [Trametes sanguinea]
MKPSEPLMVLVEVLRLSRERLYDASCHATSDDILSAEHPLQGVLVLVRACPRIILLLWFLSGNSSGFFLVFRSLPRPERSYARCVSSGVPEFLRRMVAHAFDVRLGHVCVESSALGLTARYRVFAKKGSHHVRSRRQTGAPSASASSSVHQLTAVERVECSPIQWDGGGLS